NWHVPIDPHPVADLTDLSVAHLFLLQRMSCGCDEARAHRLGMSGSSTWAARSGPACSVTSPAKIAGGRSRGSLWVDRPTPVPPWPSAATPAPGPPGKP